MPQAIDAFMKRFHRAVASRSQEIRLTLAEANDLAQEVNGLLSRLADKTTQQPAPASAVTAVVMDGGTIKDLK